MQKLQNNLPNDLKWDDSVRADYHQNHRTNNLDNVKYVSACGHFEIVYSSDHIVQNQYNNSDDMGTYNYCSPNTDKVGHLIYDVYPYDHVFNGYGNVPASERITP